MIIWSLFGRVVSGTPRVSRRVRGLRGAATAGGSARSSARLGVRGRVRVTVANN